MLVTGSLYLLADSTRRGTTPNMTKMRERLTVLAFALAVVALIVGSAFAIGYLVGKLLL